MAEDESGWGKLIDEAVNVATKYKLLQKLAGLFLNEKSVVLLCGTSGVGKSQFIRSLQEPVAAPIAAADRTRGWHKVKVTKDKRKLELLDTPGQIGEGALRRKAHLEALRAKHFGIINVVANGFHEGTATEPDAIVRVGDAYRAKDKFLTDSRKLEVQNLTEWSRDLQDARWLITLVNKADLWWQPDTCESVLKYYSSTGPYGMRLKSWEGKHVVLPYASTSKPFYDRVPMSGHFGDARRLECQVNALRSLASLIAQGKSK